MVVAEGTGGEGESAVVLWVLVHHIMVIDPDHEHDQGAEYNADGRAPRARLGQKGGSRHDEGTPPDSAPQRKCPYGQG